MTHDFISVRHASPTVRITTWILVCLILIVILGSWVAKIEIVARGQGRIVPVSRIQLVQPQTAGKVQNILIREGQVVQAGDVLIILDSTSTESEVRRISTEIKRQKLMAAISDAIITSLDKQDPSTADFIKVGVERFQYILVHSADGKILVKAHLEALRDQVLQIDAQMNKVKKAQSAKIARLEKARADSEIVTRQFASAKNLVERGTISKNEYLHRLRELKAVEGEIQIAEHEADELEAAGNALAHQRVSIISETISTYRKQLNDAGIALTGFEADLTAAQNRLINLTLTAPVKGRVENLIVHTLGGFVAAGETILSIVPIEEHIELDTFFDNRDVGFLEIGQKAYVKLDAFPAERFGVVGGQVTSIGADARHNGANSQWVYAVRLRLDQDHLRLENKTISFVSGMTATVDVITGERRLLSYFFEPITKVIQNGMKER